MNFPKASPEYAHLRTWNAPWGIVYGPVHSRRYGRSLGINLLGSGLKACSFDCVYCELGLSTQRMKDIRDESLYPSPNEVAQALRDRLADFKNNPDKPEVFSVVGNGEPTLHPHFEQVMQEVKKVRDESMPDTRIVVFSNGAHLDSREVINGLNLADERLIKLDAGNDEVLKRINRPLVRMSVERVLPGIRKLRDVSLQCMFVQGAADNTQQRELEEWIEIVGMIRPRTIQLYSLDRVPAESGLKKVDEETLDRIAALLERRTKIRAIVVP